MWWRGSAALKAATRGAIFNDATVEDPNVFASPHVMEPRTFPLRPELERTTARCSGMRSRK
jgi:hypothetical protein